MTEASDGTRALVLELLGLPRRTDDELRAMAATADWHLALELAGPGLHPMIAWRLTERRVEAPGWVKERVDGARRASAVTLARRRSHLRQALEALEAAGASATVLKGFALAHLVYPSPELRPMSDADLWIHTPTLDGAVAALKPLGWHLPWWRDITVGPAGSGGQVGLLLPSAKLMLELHREPGSLLDNTPQALDDFWSRRVPATLGGVSAWVLPAEETLIHLSLHLAEHHRFLGAVGRLLDVALVVQARSREINWPAFAERCIALGVSRWVATVLATSHEMLGAPVRPEALSAFGVAELDRLCAAAAEQAWRAPRVGEAPFSVFSAPTVVGAAARLGSRLAALFDDAGPSAGERRLSARQVFYRLRNTTQFILPGFLRQFWIRLVRPADAERLRRSNARNDALVEALRGGSPESLG